MILAAAAAYVNLTADLPSIARLPALLDAQNGLLLQPTRIYDRSGSHLLYSFDNPGIPRRFLSADPASDIHFDPKLVQAVVALQQPNFWQSSGADWKNLTDPRALTLAEQLVDSLLLDAEPASLRRSLRMRFLAAQLTGEFGRARVLEWYLNSSSYGHLTLGADNAARLYLGKSAAKLNMSEVALLLAALNAPALNPIDSPAAALENQRAVLLKLYDAGIIGSEEYLGAVANPPTVRAELEPANPVARAFSARVINDLSDRFGRRRVERGGLQVITTLDYDLQLQLSCTLRTQLARMQNLSASVTLPDGLTCSAARLLPTISQSAAWPANLTASAVITDPASGQILAYIGDSTRQSEQPTLTPRQPGSTLSPFLAVSAFARGFSPASLVWDIPATNDAATSIENYHGPVRLRMALANDYLPALNSLLNQIGPTTVWRSAVPFGLGSLSTVPASDNLLTSGGQVTALELASAYGVFANQGFKAGTDGSGQDPQPVSILTVQDSSGQTLLDQTTASQLAVLSPQLSYLVHNVFSDEAARWPSLGYPNPLEIGRPAGARAVQTALGTQSWSVGYTRHYSVAVWLGLPAGTARELLDVRYAAGVWHAVMLYAESSQPVENWAVPAGISRLDVCDPSGLLPDQDCPNQVSEIFITGSEPTTSDNLYRSYAINRETGRLATVFTPPAWIEERTYLIIPPEAAAWAALSGIETPPSAYDAVQAPVVQPDVNITVPVLFSYVRGDVNIRGTASGENFSSYKIQAGSGIQPDSWLQIGDASTSPARDKTLATWSTASIPDGLYALRLMVVRSDARLETAVIQVTVDNTPPTASVLYPAGGQTFSAATDSQITLLAGAADQIGIERVEWWLDGTRIGDRSQQPYTLPWKASIGQHTLEVRVYDLAGNSTVSDKIEFVVTK